MVIVYNYIMLKIENWKKKKIWKKEKLLIAHCLYLNLVYNMSDLFCNSYILKYKQNKVQLVWITPLNKTSTVGDVNSWICANVHIWILHKAKYRVKKCNWPNFIKSQRSCCTNTVKQNEWMGIIRMHFTWF